jgi:hypothetical protein
MPDEQHKRSRAQRDAFDPDSALAALQKIRLDDIEGFMAALRKIVNASLGVDNEASIE